MAYKTFRNYFSTIPCEYPIWRLFLCSPLLRRLWAAAWEVTSLSGGPVQVSCKRDSMHQFTSNPWLSLVHRLYPRYGCVIYHRPGYNGVSIMQRLKCSKLFWKSWTYARWCYWRLYCSSYSYSEASARLAIKLSNIRCIIRISSPMAT